MLLLAKGLAAHPGIESMVVTGSGTLLAERCRADGIPLREASWSMGIDPRVMAPLLGILHPAMIVHAHDQHAHTLADAAARIRSSPVVVTRRVEFPVRHPARWHRASQVIALSSAVRDRLITGGVETARITVIPPAVDLAAVDESAPPRWPESIPQPATGSPLVVCIAALTPEKGLDTLLDAAALLLQSHPDLQWIVLGEGRLRAELTQKRAALGLEQVVALPGHLDHPAAILAHATLMVQPSRSEGFGSSILDALSLGIPVVASNVGGLPESLAAGGGLLVPADDAAALAQSVAELVDDHALRERLGGDGRIAAEQFDLPVMVSRTVEVYRSALMNRAKQ